LAQEEHSCKISLQTTMHKKSYCIS